MERTRGKIIIIAAMDQNRIIGKDGKIPWKLSADLGRFKDLTMSHPVIMGRKTYESLGKPLPGRTNIILSRDENFTRESANGCAVSPFLEEALKLACIIDKEKIFVMGGGQVYEDALFLADEIYLTLVKASFEGDIFFPKLNLAEWSEVSREPHKKDEKNPYDYEFIVYRRT